MSQSTALTLMMSLTILGSSAFAASKSSMAVPATSAAPARGASTLSQPQVSPSSASKTRLEGAVRYEFTQYTTALEGDPHLNQSQLMATDLRLGHSTARTDSKLDFTAGKYVDLGSSYFSVQELYTSALFKSEALTVSLGRKLEFWSQVDADWELGFWEPKYNIDTLRPVNQGLTGLFMKSRYGKWEFLAFASPIFIPTINPEIHEKNGTLRSDSRWYKTPAGAGPVLNRDTRLVYSISIPELEKLVMNPGAAMRLRYGGDAPGAWASVNFARKPINMLLIKYDYNLYLASSGSQAEIEVSPTVGYHRLYGADAGWVFKNAMLSASYLLDQPEHENTVNNRNAAGEATTDWIQQSAGDVRIWALHGRTNLQVPWILDPVAVNVDYIKADETLTRDLDEKGQVRGAFFPHRLNFTNAVSLKTTASTRIWGKTFLSSFRYLRDFDQQGSLWTLMGQYFPTKDWALHAGLDLLGVDDDAVTNTDKRFLNQFRANDRVYGGLSYVF